MSYNPQNTLRDLTRNPLHVGLVVACCVLSFLIIAVVLFRDLGRPARKKIHPLDRPPVKASKEPAAAPARVPHASEFPAELAILCERSKLQDWGRFEEAIKVRAAVYLAASLHPNDSPYAHGERAFFYFNVLNVVREKEPDLMDINLTIICVANDHHFADYLASKAEAPK